MKATMLALSDTAHSKTAGCTMRPPAGTAPAFYAGLL